MTWKNNRELRQGIEVMFRVLLASAKRNSREAGRYHAMHEAGSQWAFNAWMEQRNIRKTTMHTARMLREVTHNGVPHHVVGVRLINRAFKEAA